MKKLFFYYTAGNIIDRINNLLWSDAAIFLIIAAGVILTVRTGFPQASVFSFLKRSVGLSKHAAENADEHFSAGRAVSTALAASMGTGNIAGAAAAVAAGGAGAVFWMLAAAFTGMAAAYAENYLGTESGRQDGTPPLSYIRKLPCGKILSSVYGCACIGASFLMGNMLQSRVMCESAVSLTGGNMLLVTLICTAAVGIVIAGGENRVSAAAQAIIPTVSVIYILSAAAVVIRFSPVLPDTAAAVLTGAFSPQSVKGGLIGAGVKNAVSVGMRRGIFSNEAGLGSSILVHSRTNCKEPSRVGMWAVCEVFLDTFICCTVTALAVLCAEADLSAGEVHAVEYAFSAVFGNYGKFFVSLSMMLFAAASVIGWCCCGEICLNALIPQGGKKAAAIYRICHILLFFAGGLTDISLLWGAADIVNWVMLAINLSALLILFPCKNSIIPKLHERNR